MEMRRENLKTDARSASLLLRGKIEIEIKAGSTRQGEAFGDPAELIENHH